MSECGCGGHGAATITAPEPVLEETPSGCGCGGNKKKNLPEGKDDLGLKSADHSGGGCGGQGRGHGQGHGHEQGHGGGGCGCGGH